LGGAQRLLVVDDLVPHPGFGYGYPRSFNILKFLAISGFRVTFYPLSDRRRTEPSATILESLGVRVLCNDTDRGRNLKSFLAMQSDCFDAIWVSRLKNLKAVVQARAQVCDDQLLIYDAEAFNAPGELLQWHLDGIHVPTSTVNESRNEEIEFIQAADVVVAVSDQDAALMRRAGISPIFVLGHVFDPINARTSFEERAEILFLGSFFGRTPNEDAVRYFANEIMPILSERIDASWTIAGYRSENILNTLPERSRSHIRVAGTLGELGSTFDRARVFVVPTRRWAAGAPHKVHQALAHGVPAVVTPLIAEQVGDKAAVLSGGDPAGFADSVCELYTNRYLWTSQKDSGLAMVNEECSAERCLSALAAIRERI
jgi:O-antigen biosynthesis protein